MATCEIYDDILNFLKEEADPFLEGDQKLADERVKKQANLTTLRFYHAVRYLLVNQFAFADASALPTKTIVPGKTESKDLLIALADDEKKANFLAVTGVLLADSFRDPLLGKKESQLGGTDIVIPALGADPQILIATRFVAKTVDAVKEYKTHSRLFLEVYAHLREAGEIAVGVSDVERHVKARQLAEVTRLLVSEGADPRDPQLSVRIDRALALNLGGLASGRPSAIDIDLPELEEGTEADIIKDNVLALSAVYFAAMLEELKFFAVAEKVVEEFVSGALPITRGNGGEALYRYYKEAHLRMTEIERRSLYARSFGLAQGSVEEPLPNREFNDLWTRFISAVSYRGRERHSTERQRTSEQQVFKSARDLGVNLSVHGYALAHFAAVELQSQVRTIKDMLSAPDILAAFGVRDVWQLVERVSNGYLAGSVNSVRQRTMAQSGARIIQWIADRSPILAGAGTIVQLDDEIISQVERWLAVTGTPDETVERFSEPIALQSQRTIPDLGQLNLQGSMQDALQKVNTLLPVALPQA